LPINVQTLGRNGERKNVEIEGNPDRCPICANGIEPIDIKVDFFFPDGWGRLERVFRCPRQNCEDFFIARYQKKHPNGYHVLDQCVPVVPVSIARDESIIAISPNFHEIYNQAQKAEQYGLNLIAGAGYRKSLEFLIKDLPHSIESGCVRRDQKASPSHLH